MAMASHSPDSRGPRHHHSSYAHHAPPYQACHGASQAPDNLSALGADAGISYNTARSWLSVLERPVFVAVVLHDRDHPFRESGQLSERSAAWP